MIAANYRKFPQAMALQLVLVFGRCTWHTARPTQRAARAVRAARGDLVKHTPQLVRWVKKTVPAWFKLAKRKALELSNQVREACGVFVWDLVDVTGPAESESAANQVIELLAKPRANVRLFTWAIRGSERYQSWISMGQHKMFINASSSLGYRG